MAVFASHASTTASSGPGLTWTNFRDALRDLAEDSVTAKGRRVAVTLFELLDVDGNGVVDLGEAVSGVSVLCGSGTGMPDVKAVFSLNDVNHDGKISHQELVR